MNMVRILPVAALLCLLLASTCLAKVPPEARQALHKAQLLMNDKQFGQAAQVIAGYTNTTKEPIHEQVYIFHGAALHQAGQLKKALAVFQKGRKAFPKSESLSLNTGIALYELERYAEAGKLFETTYRLQNPGKPALLFQAGSAYYLGRSYQASANVLTRLMAEAKAPRKEWIQLTIHALIDAGKHRRAESVLLRYLDATPEDSDYWRLLAKLHLDREEYSKAAAALEICCRLDAPSRQDLQQLASLYNYQQAPLMAARTLQRASAVSPKPDDALRISALYASAGRIRQALEYLDRTLPNESAAIKKGRMLYRARQFMEAETLFQQQIDKADNPEARFFLALCAWERKDWERAEKELAKIAGLRQYKSRTAAYLAVLEDLKQARLESGG